MYIYIGINMKVIGFIILVSIVGFIMETLKDFSLFLAIVWGVAGVAMVIMYLASCLER